ncbi:MAG: class I adenylate-forming enzyme family protein [Steroidobacteraceae bacterium]
MTHTHWPLLISSGLRTSAARTPTKRALRCEGRSLTYAELALRSARVTGAAFGAGLCKGDRVVLLAPNCLEYPELMCGLTDAGLIVATLSPRLSEREVREACQDCGARWIIAHPAAAASVPASGTVERVLWLGEEYESWIAEADARGPLADLGERDPFTLVYSSGTTGKPKGIVISHRSRVLTFHGMAREYGCYGPADLQLGIAPMSHGAGFAFIMASLFFAGEVEVLPRFEPELVLSRLAAESFTGVFMVPAHFHAIFALEPAVLDRYRGRFTALRTIMSNASALPQATKARIVDYFGEGLLHETYGSTEAGIVTNLRPPDQLRRIQSVGMPFALNEVRLLDEEGRQVAPGEVGELFSRSPYLFDGYFGKQEETSAAMRDGWVTAGDLARRDEDGYLYIVDRKKDMVISGGFNVYPREIEEQLVTHPDVAEAAVVGVPDDHWGERLVAFIVVRRGAEFSEEILQAFCRQQLAGYKVPKQYLAIEALPRNAGGKVLKNELRHSLKGAG